MTDDYSIDLLNFTSVFELLCAYYLLLGISEKLRNYFEISTWFRDWIANDYIYENNLDQIESYLKAIEETNNRQLQEHIASKGFLGKIRMVFSHLLKDIEIGIKKRGKKRIMDKIHFLRRKLPIFYPTIQTENGISPNEAEYSTSFLEAAREDGDKITYSMLIRPVYLYFGVLSIILLILAGSYSSLKREFALSLINSFSIILLGVFLFCLFVKKYRCHFITILSPVKAFLLTLILIGLIIVIPERFLAFLGLIPNFLPSNSIRNSNFQVILCIVLHLTPLLINITSLAFIVRKLQVVRNYYRNTISLPLKERIIIPGEIPKLGP